VQRGEYLWFVASSKGYFSREVVPISINGMPISREWKDLEPNGILNQLGEAGWELVASNAMLVGDPVGLMGWIFHLKRPKPNIL
jgi:hypothetical protein